ncbi:unnamed protein product [Calypogeia fissa]
MYLRGSKGYPFKRRRVHAANRSPSPIDKVVKKSRSDCNCDTIPCSNIQGKYYRPLFPPPPPKCTAICTSETVTCYNIPDRDCLLIPTPVVDERPPFDRQVSAIYKIRLPRDFVVGYEQADFERKSRWHVDVPEEIVQPDVEMEDVPEVVVKEKEWVLTKDPLSEYYFYEELPDPLAEPVAPVLPTEVVVFDPRDFGSFPPKPPGMLLFREVKRKRLDNCTLDSLEEEEVMQRENVGQPERENPPRVTAPPESVRPARHLPLKYFDNPSLELRHPEAALNEALARGERGLRARSKAYWINWNEAGFWEPRFTWKPCLVYDYDPPADLYSVTWLAPNGEETRRGKRVSRLNLIFDGENDASFILRRLHAVELRGTVEAELRYSFLIDELPFYNPETLNEPMMKRIMFVAGGRMCFLYPKTVEECMKECRHDYHRSTNYSIIKHEFLTNEEVRERLTALKIFPVGNEPAPVPIRGCLPIQFAEQSDFQITRNVILKTICLAEVAFNSALQHYYVYLSIDTKHTLVCPELYTLPKPWKLRAFRRIQIAYVEETAAYLKYDWPSRVVGLIEDLAPVMSMLNEAAKEKLQKFVARLSFTMSEQLQALVIASVEEFKTYLEFCRTRKAVPDHAARASLRRQSIYGGLGKSMRDTIFQNFEKETPKDPLFRLFLIVEGDHLIFKPSIDLVHKTIVELLDDMVTSLQGTEGLQSRLRSLFSYDFEPTILQSVPLDDPRVAAARETAEEILELNFVLPRKLMEMYNVFDDLLKIQESEFLETWKTDNHSLDDYENEILRFREVANDVKLRTETETAASMFLVDCSRARDTLAKKARHLGRRLCHQIMDDTSAKNKILDWKYSTMETRVLSPINNAEDLDMMLKYLAEIKFDLPQRREDVKQSMQVWEVLEKASFHVPDMDSVLFWQTVAWPKRIGDEVNDAEQKIARLKVNYAAEHNLNSKQLMKDVKALAEVIKEFKLLGQIETWEERFVFCQEIEDKLKKYLDLADLYNTREEILGLFVIEYTQVEQLEREFELYGMLWHTCHDFLRAHPLWMDGPFQEIDGEQMVQSMDKWFRTAAKCAKMLTHVEPKIVAEDLKRRIEAFQVNVPFVAALRAPGMRDRHWKKLCEMLDFDVSPNFTTRQFNEQLNMIRYTPQCEEISEIAAKEYALERSLDKMQQEWMGINFEYKTWKETGTNILCSIDDIQTQLDDQLMKTQSMQASPYVAPFEDRVKVWLGKLTLMKKIIDEWLKCQIQWTYLEAIFTSEDIMQQMPTEGRRFRQVDTVWRGIMKKVAMNPDALSAASDEETYLELQQNNKDLDVIQAGLNDYLETKRLAFPRFYFLSNDELLEILAETKDPLRVQPFLKKIFEGIHLIEFTKNLFIVAMMSEEGERVEFDMIINPKAAQGAVEKWFTQVEQTMKTSLRYVLTRAFKAYAGSKREEWLLNWPGQIAICVSQMYWTAEVAQSIRSGTLKDYEEKCTHQLQGIVEKVRGKLTKLERKTIGALITLDVHARDVVKELADEDLRDETDFSWICQLRYTYEEDAVLVRMINAALLYAFEYLGNSPRLVITPLTDRCYRTLMGALHLNLGGAPEGPAGTGKTETTKDLAKAIAMQCVVFNCSDGLDYLAMGKFFKGLASSGAWSCFDEFNRIDLEVLSVIAQQILTIQRAKAAMLKSFDFEGTRLTLKPSCSVFITMNPGYAGRSELPDNLKALFRTVAMMVPDYALISEITLYSFGYLDARELGRKLVATYRLCSEQLSSQNHYDYGMRAVISVLRAAGAVKQKYPEEREDVLMLRSLKDVNLPKFLAHDIPLFEGILKDLFPGVTLPPPDYDKLRISVEANCVKFNLQSTAIFVEKIFQLYEMILVRHGLMLVGYSYGAKTESYRVLAAALSDLQAQNLELTTRYFVLNPKSIYIGQLYGQFDPVSHEWTDGVLAKIFRDAAVDATPDRKWIIFDGPVDAVWIENMNTVLDDNKKLCLMSGEIIQMTSVMNLIFEVQDLAVASPATVSRCGMVYVEPSAIGFWPLIISWEKKLVDNYLGIGEAFPMIRAMLKWLVDPCVDFIRRHCKELIATSPINLVNSLLNMFESHLDEFKPAPVEKPRRASLRDPEEELIKLPKADDLNVWIQCLFCMSLVWSIGATVDQDGRVRFNEFLRRLLDKEDDLGFELSAGLVVEKPDFKLSLPYPDTGSVYDYAFWKGELAWKEWIMTVNTRPPPPDIGYNDIIVPTVDTARYSYLFVLLVLHNKHVLFGGPTGTGKTVYIKYELSHTLDKELFRNILMTFSAQTNANQTQDIIDGKLDKRKKGVFGPPKGCKCVIFVDDLNMPSLEVYGAQPPIEILRQWMDHGGWYNREDLGFRQIVDIQFAAAMGPPGGGRNSVTPRYMRHYNVLSILDLDDGSLSTVFNTIIDWWIRKAHLPHEVLSISSLLVTATIDVYRAIQQELLPTPSKSHYLYNMRDISKIFQGVTMIGVTVGKKGLVRLWCHECLRVFHDRLVNDEDRLWFLNFLSQKVERDLTMSLDYLFGVTNEGSNIIEAMKDMNFGDIMDATAVPKRYEEIDDPAKLLDVMNTALNEYNAQTRNVMSLVLFSYAAQHVLRISRVIRQPFGNALLVGLGGSGRQSLTRLATFIASFSLFQIEITKLYGLQEWKDDLQKVLRKAGAQNVSTVFLFNDTQLKMEQFLEDINNILNTGEESRFLL